MTDIKDTTLRGVNLLRNPWFNKSSAFTEEERDELGLRGLLPPRVSTFDEQVTRLKGIIDTYEKPINKYIDYIDAPEDTFEQYVEKALKYNFRCVFADRKSTRLNSSHANESRMPSSA